MNANKLFSEFSLKKIWDKLLQHDKAMNSTLLILSSGNWTKQEDGTFINTVFYSTFKDTDKLTVDLYDNGKLSDTLLTEYEQYIDSFEIVNGALVVIANTKPTQSFTLVIKGEFEVDKVEVPYVECVNDFTSVSTDVPASGNLVRILHELIQSLESKVNSNKNNIFYNEADSSIYVNGVKWQTIDLYWDGYFYNHGLNSKNLYQDSRWSSGSNSRSVSFGASSLTMSSTKQDVTGNGIAVSSDVVDLSNYSVIEVYFDKTAHGNGGIWFGVYAEGATPGGSSLAYVAENAGNGTNLKLTIPLNSIPAELKKRCFISFMCWAGYSGNETVVIKYIRAVT